MVQLKDFLESKFSEDFLGVYAPNRKAGAPLFCLNTASAQEVKNFGQITESGENRVWEVVADCWAKVGNQPGDATKFLAAIMENLRENASRNKAWDENGIRIMEVELSRIGTTLNPDQMAQALRITFQVETDSIPN
jgi:hypothetical protein